MTAGCATPGVWAVLLELRQRNAACPDRPRRIPRAPEPPDLISPSHPICELSDRLIHAIWVHFAVWSPAIVGPFELVDATDWPNAFAFGCVPP